MLAGRYRLEDRVRTRPGGSLWRAVDETLDRPVLVQAFALGHPYGAEIVDAARRAALVEDPRLQRVLAAGEERGTAYVVLERLAGRTLVELLDSGPLPAEIARRIVGEAAQALDRAAARGLHHLRLRPTSLVIGPDGTVVVVGTAIDAAADGAESPNTTVATRSDAVGLVALLYSALTGRWPGAQDAGLARAPRVAGRPVPPGDLVAGVPNDLDTLCAVALGPHEDGPRTPGELAAQLSPWAPAAPLTDPRGLQLGGPPRPSASGDDATLLPQEAQPAETPARRTPAWGLRVNRRGRGPVTGPQPVVPAAPTPPTADEPGRAPTGRPAWATVDELRRALRRAAPAPAGPAPGAGLPIAAAAPPAGAPLASAPAPAGAPFADTVAPAGPPTAAPTTAATAAPAAAPTAAPTAAPAAGADADADASTATDAASPAVPQAPPVREESAEPLREPSEDTADADRRAEPPAALTAPPAPPASRAVPADAPTTITPAVPVEARRAPPAEPVPVRSGARAVPVEQAATMAMPPVRAVPPAAQPWGGNGNARGRAPVAEDVHALDMFGVQAQPVDPVEAVAPFGPEVPLTRPPREQSRLVLVVLGVLLVVAFVFAGRQLLNFSPEPLISRGGGAPSTPRGSATAAPASPGPAPSPSTPGSAPAASPVAIAGVQALDPQGDESENNDLAARAIDGESDTAWRSERYDTPVFGGIKKGVGLALDLGDPTAVTTATLAAPGTDGTVELRAGDSPDYDGSSVVASARVDGGRIVLRTARPVQTRYLLVWFTRAPEQDNGERRVLVSEIDIR